MESHWQYLRKSRTAMNLLFDLEYFLLLWLITAIVIRVVYKVGYRNGKKDIINGLKNDTTEN